MAVWVIILSQVDLWGSAWWESLSTQLVGPVPDHLLPLPVLDLQGHHHLHLLRQPHCPVFLHCSRTKKPNSGGGVASSGSASLFAQVTHSIIESNDWGGHTSSRNIGLGIFCAFSLFRPLCPGGPSPNSALSSRLGASRMGMRRNWRSAYRTRG